MVDDHTYLISWYICVSVGGRVTWRARWVMWKHSVMKLKSPDTEKGGMVYVCMYVHTCPPVDIEWII